MFGNMAYHANLLLQKVRTANATHHIRTNITKTASFNKKHCCLNNRSELWLNTTFTAGISKPSGGDFNKETS